MRDLAIGPELHVRYMIEKRERNVELEALLRDVGGPHESILLRLRSALGLALISIGEHLATTSEARRQRALSACDVRRVRTGVS